MNPHVNRITSLSLLVESRFLWYLVFIFVSSSPLPSVTLVFSYLDPNHLSLHVFILLVFRVLFSCKCDLPGAIMKNITVQRLQLEETKRTIIRLEQSAHACTQRAIAAQDAFAVLYGRHSKHFIKKPEVC